MWLSDVSSVRITAPGRAVQRVSSTVPDSEWRAALYYTRTTCSPTCSINAERTAPCHISRASPPGQPGAPLQARAAARLEQDQEAPYARPTLTPDRTQPRALSRTRRKSESSERSCTSSTMTCVVPASAASPISRRSSTPVVLQAGAVCQPATGRRCKLPPLT